MCRSILKWSGMRRQSKQLAPIHRHIALAAIKSQGAFSPLGGVGMLDF